MSTVSLAPPTSSFLLKGSQYTVTTLQLLSTDLTEVEDQLTQKIAQAPQFFINTAVMIDLQRLNPEGVEMNLAGLLHILRAQKLLPIGVRGGQPSQQETALKLGYPVFSARESSVASAPSTSAPSKIPTPKHTLVDQPIRSGQQIHAPEGDLIIVGAVGSGAEVLAQGHIHVYGPLRGRALAGINGNSQARIFCQSLEAELVSIAGQYCVNEDLRCAHFGKAVMITLEGEHLQITALS